MEATFLTVFLVTFVTVTVVGVIHEDPEPSYFEPNGNLSHFATFPPFNAERDLVFYLYNDDKSEEVIRLNNMESLSKSSFRPERPTRIFIAGYLSTKTDSQALRDAYQEKGGVNNLYVDWSKGSNASYRVAALVRVPKAGRVLAKFVDFLVRGGASYDTTYLIGHSFGAHIVGIAGKNTAGKVNTIFGLDPAGTLFSLNRPQGRIARGDAKYVEIIHTDIVEGFFAPLGDADFFVNGGKVQPGCTGALGFLCAHLRAELYFRESINNNDFWAVPCSYINIKLGKCNSRNYTVRMGGEPSNGDAASPPRGTFYLRTNSESPFALGMQ